MELREAFGAPAYLYLAMLPKELFFGWWGRAPWQLVLFAAAVALPSVVGAVRAAREAPREAAAMAAFLAISCAAVVLYGVGKARYLHPVAWIPLLGFALGVAELARRAARALERLAPAGRWIAAALAAVVALFACVVGLLRLAGAESATPRLPDFAFAVLVLALLAAACAELVPRTAGARAAACLAFALAAPVALGGVERKLALVTAVHDFDAGAAPAAAWLAEHLPPGERVAVLHRSQVIFASGLPRERVVPFSRFEAGTLEALREELAREGVRYVVYTWRRAPETDAERFYAHRRREDLAALFASGAPLPGFAHLATLPADPRLHQPPAQIYHLDL